MEMEREVKIRHMLVDPTNNSPIILLKDVNSDSMVPIWVGPFEAGSIASEIEKNDPPRPMTHDLLRNIINQMGGIVKRVIITDLRDNIFYAVIEITVSESIVLIDSRPSDAIALALRVDCPIYIREEVWEAQRSEDSIKVLDDDIADDDEEVDWPEEIDDLGTIR